ncbi:MAG: hypothetical protein KJ626_14520 [Verrucomicrobia bacterium]|nr:hypothetical protein [Verrucomicrobiota bacterium]
MNQQPLPGHAEQPKEIVCPSCGRFVGPIPRCPHCGTRITARMSITFFRWASLLLGTVGLGLLYLMSIHKDIPIIEVGSISPTMNFAYVRVAGTVSADARITQEGNAVKSVRFIIDDGTGEIPVTAFRQKGQALVDSGLIPRVGDKVIATGSLSVSADRIALWLQAPEQLEIEHAGVQKVTFDEIVPELAGSRIQIDAAIVKFTEPPEGVKRPWVILITDGENYDEITFWSDTADQFEDFSRLERGVNIRAIVSVGTYRGKTQLKLSQAADIEFLNEQTIQVPERQQEKQSWQKQPSAKKKWTPKNQEVALADISKDIAGAKVRFSGVVKELLKPTEEKAPHKLIVSDGYASVTVVFWDKVAEVVLADGPVEAGTPVEVTGEVNVYEDELQVKVRFSNDVKVGDSK